MENDYLVLIIDADADNRDIQSAALRHHGYRVVTAEGLEAGIRAAVRERPSVIITELFVPSPGGWTVLEALRGTRATAEIPIIALSAHVFPHERDRAADADVFIPKPADVYFVLNEVERLCQGGC